MSLKTMGQSEENRWRSVLLNVLLDPDGILCSVLQGRMETVHLFFRAELFAVVFDRPFYAANGKYVCFR